MLAVSGVRPAVPLDAVPIADVQLRSWQAGVSAGFPAAALTALSRDEVTDGWASAIAAPPSGRHRVLVAVSDGVLVGFAATAPAADPDARPAVEAEIVALSVDPSHRVAGHGSRLLAACVDGFRDERVEVAYAWVTEADQPGRAFLLGAGWAADGARRELDLHGDGITRVEQVRLHTAVGPPPPAM